MSESVFFRNASHERLSMSSKDGLIPKYILAALSEPSGSLFLKGYRKLRTKSGGG